MIYIKKIIVNLPDIVGCGYKDFFLSKKRFLVCKGGRASKKSTTASLKIICMMMNNSQMNALVVRQFYASHRDSTFNQLLWAIDRLQVSNYWKSSLSPLKLIYKPTGQTILFKGLSDPQSIKSILPRKGFLNIVWIEEAQQIPTLENFNTLNMSIRGELPTDVYEHFIITFNPVHEKHWLKKRFFDQSSPNVDTLSTNYLYNEWVGQGLINEFEEMKERNPRLYKVDGLGCWGLTEGLVYENWNIEYFDIVEIENLEDIRGNKIYKKIIGMDFGYEHDPTAIIISYVNQKTKELFVAKEHYAIKMRREHITETCKKMGTGRTQIIADNQPELIASLRQSGLNIIKAKKPKGSIVEGIQRLHSYKITVHPSCINTIKEFESYVWQNDKTSGDPLNNPVDKNNHAMDALRYSLQALIMTLY